MRAVLPNRRYSPRQIAGRQSNPAGAFRVQEGTKRANQNAPMDFLYSNSETSLEEQASSGKR